MRMTQTLSICTVLIATFLAVSSAHAHYSPELGRWLERDPAGYVDGMNLYDCVSGRPLTASDSSGLWKRERPSHVWEAETDDTLRDLASRWEYGGDPRNWSCLWPVGSTEDHGYPIIKKCDRYDAGNLASLNFDSTELRVSVAKDLVAGHSAVYGNVGYLRGDKVPTKIKKISREGATPISFLLVGGHSLSGYGVSDQSGRYEFDTNDLTTLNIHPTFSRAKKKKGPLRCWFTRNAQAVFPGCQTSTGLARPFAAHVLRKGATAWGTNQSVGHSEDGLLYWDAHIDSNGKLRWRESTPWWRSSSAWDVWSGQQ